MGQELDVIIEGESEEGIIGRTYGDAPEVDNMVHVSIPEDCEYLPAAIKVKITEADTYDLFGDLI